MKRYYLCLYMAFMLMLLISSPAYAADTGEYELEELGLTVSIPSDYAVITRDISDNDPYMGNYDLTKDELLSYMKENDVYLSGWNDDNTQEIVITMNESLFSDFNLYSDTVLTIVSSSIADTYKNAGITVIESEIYQHAQTKFAKLYISQPISEGTAYGLQYCTIYDGKAISITIQSYSGQITSVHETALKSIVDSIVFDAAPQVRETDFTPTDAYTYTDPKTLTTFTVPANWVETPVSEEEEPVDVEFASLEEGGMSIMYASSDIWNEMPASERRGHTRADIDNRIITKSEIADIYGLSNSDIKLVTYGGNEYYTATVTLNSDEYGLSFEVTLTHMFLITNGYAHWFQFSGSSDNGLYNDFVSLLSSVQPVASESKSAFDNSNDLASQFSLEAILFSVLITIIVYSLPIIIFRYAIKKSPLNRKQAKKITIIYGVCAFVAMSVLLSVVNGSGTAGGAIFLWSWVNYRVLISGEAKDNSPEMTEDNPFPVPSADCGQDFTEAGEQSPHSMPKVEETKKVCPFCGTVMPVENKFCHKCGAKMNN